MVLVPSGGSEEDGPFRGSEEDGVSEDLSEAPGPTTVTPDLIKQLGTSFMAIRHLIAAAEVGVFEALLTARSTWMPWRPGSPYPGGPPGSALTPWRRSAFWSETGPCTGTALWPTRS